MDEDDAPHQTRWPRVAVRVIGCTVLAVGLYVLNVGPVSYLFFNRSAMLNQMYDQIYLPLALARRADSLLVPIRVYLTWWNTLPDGPGDRANRYYRDQFGVP